MLASLVGTVVAGHAADRQGPAPPYVAGVVLVHGGAAGVRGRADDAAVRRRPRGPGPRGGRGSARSPCLTIGRAFSEAERPRQFAILSSAWVDPRPRRAGLGGLVAEGLGWRSCSSASPCSRSPPRSSCRGCVRSADRRYGRRRARRCRSAPRCSSRSGPAGSSAGLGSSTWLVAVPLVLRASPSRLPAFRRLTPHRDAPSGAAACPPRSRRGA